MYLYIYAHTEANRSAGKNVLKSDLKTGKEWKSNILSAPQNINSMLPQLTILRVAFCCFHHSLTTSKSQGPCGFQWNFIFIDRYAYETSGENIVQVFLNVH